MQTMTRKKMQVAVAFALAAASAPAMLQAADTINTERLEAKIQTTYELSPYLRSHDIVVAVSKEGEATLTGKVGEAIDKELAEQIALGVDGIQKVKNDIAIEADYVPKTARSTRNFGDKVDDFSISTAVKSKLLWSKHTDGMDIKVSSLAGVVTLGGTAKSAEARELAENIAMNTEGVRKVDNKLVVSAAAADRLDGSAGQPKAAGAAGMVSDSWITSKVKSTYLYSSNLDNSDIDVSTKEGVVTLKGKLANGAEQALAIELANNVRGVVKVNSDALTFAAR